VSPVPPAAAEAGLDAAGVVPVVPPPVVGDGPPITAVLDPDLARVRAVVEAAGGATDVSWAAAIVVDTVGTRRLVVTSDRGRGWIPASAVLPVDSVLPWSHPQSSRWEGVRDPARVIVEFAAAVRGRVAALASSHSSAPPAAAGLPWAFADGTVQAHPELLDGPLVTRFELQVPASLREKAAAITDTDGQRAQALYCAIEADRIAGSTPIRRAIWEPMNEHRTRLGDRRWLAQLPWEALENAHQQTCDRERRARVDARNVPLGELDSAGAGRGELAQAYADEALLAMRSPGADCLRDALYAWQMLRQIPPPAPANPLTAGGL